MATKKTVKLKLREDDGAGAAPAAEGAAPAAPAAPAADGAGHDDAAQDKALIKQMLADTFGEDVANDQEANDMAHGFYAGAKKSGESHEEAMACSKYGMKAAKHKAEAAAADAAGSGQTPAPVSAEAAPSAVEGDTNPAAGTMEAAKKEAAAALAKVKTLTESNARLTAENLKFKTAQEKAALAAHVDKLCAESKLPVKVTKGFRELIKESKSAAEVDRVWKVFKETFVSESSGSDDTGAGFAFALEKNAHIDNEASAGSAKTDLSDCLS